METIVPQPKLLALRRGRLIPAIRALKASVSPADSNVSGPSSPRNAHELPAATVTPGPSGGNKGGRVPSPPPDSPPPPPAVVPGSLALFPLPSAVCSPRPGKLESGSIVCEGNRQPADRMGGTLRGGADGHGWESRGKSLRGSGPVCLVKPTEARERVLPRAGPRSTAGGAAADSSYGRLPSPIPPEGLEGNIRPKSQAPTATGCTEYSNARPHANIPA